MATFKETCALISRKNIAEPGMIIPNFSEKFQFFLLHSSVFALEKQTKNPSFQSFLLLRYKMVGYFQWNAWTCFQKISSWRRYSNVKLLKNISNFLNPLLRFCFRILASKILIFEVRLPLNKPLVTNFTETRPFT